MTMCSDIISYCKLITLIICEHVYLDDYGSNVTNSIYLSLDSSSSCTTIRATSCPTTWPTSCTKVRATSRATSPAMRSARSDDKIQATNYFPSCIMSCTTSSFAISELNYRQRHGGTSCTLIQATSSAGSLATSRSTIDVMRRATSSVTKYVMTRPMNIDTQTDYGTGNVMGPDVLMALSRSVDTLIGIHSQMIFVSQTLIQHTQLILTSPPAARMLSFLPLRRATVGQWFTASCEPDHDFQGPRVVV
jgi:hypothetical protein